ncbi:hypothetical protein DUNSADRAFT_6405 [Dunaliella salina]|uniref:Uncharacterized protein n=1 Tax=Dunaliella salina TaxID=3046 RepID=A0ABQ7H6R9_DUNSA|nr:hypothetical protein DUNSADRAFT_6405 [Dunaliella salina]|eukprot:KAF5842555.1 hypothetical protein DUNSADRAFT_6405 [Dunaliella salina]
MDTAAHAARAQHARLPRSPSSPSGSPGVFFNLSSNGVTAPVPKLGNVLQSGQAEAWTPAHGGEGLDTANSWGGGQVGGAKPPPPRAGTLPDMRDLEGWEQEEYFADPPTHAFPLSRPNGSEGPPVWPCPNPLPPPRMHGAREVASVMSGHTDGGIDLCLIDQYLSLFTGRVASRGAGGKFDAVGALMLDSPGKKRANLASLGLDRPTLERQGMAPHHINRVYNLLHSNAMAFALTVSAEQRRLAALFTTKPGLPLQDRLLAFVMGSEADLEDELLPPGSSRARGQEGESLQLGEDCVDDEGVRMLAREADLKLAPLSSEDLIKEPDKIVDMDEAIAMAAAGNVVGLRRLLGRYRQLHKAVRARLEGRLKHEVQRAQRLQDRLDAKEAELQENHQQLGLATTEVNSASARVQALEEELAREHEVVVAGQAINESLRDEIADVEAQWAAQQAETVARVTDQLQMLQQQSEGELDLREQYLQRLRELVTLQLRHDHEARKAKRLGDELSAVRAAGQAAAAEAAALKVWRGRLEERAENAEGWALASKASAFDGIKAFQKEQAAHKATLDRLHMVEHRVEHARTAAADMHARFSKLIKEQSAAAREANTRAVKLQRQVEEAQDMIRIRAFEVDSAKSAHTAAQQMAERVVRDHFDIQGILAHKEAKLKETEQKGAQDSVNVEKLRQEKYVLEAELIAVRKALSDVSDFIQERERTGAKLASNEKEMADLKQSLSEVQATSSGLERQVSFLRVREEHKRATDTIERQEMELDNAARRRESDEAALEGIVEQLGKVQAAEHEARNRIKVLKARLDMSADDLDNLTLTKKRLQDEVAELKKLIGVVADLRAEVLSLKQRLEAAEQAQGQALADQKWWTSARQHMQEDLQEFLAAGAFEAQAIMAMCASIQEGMASLRGSMLGLLEGDAPKEGEPSPLASVDAAKAAKAKVHKEAMLKLQEAERQQPQQLSGVDPEMSLSSLVPAFLLEAQAKEISRLRAAEGELRAQHAAAVAHASAIQTTLEGERSSDQTRQQHFTALVSMLRDQVLTLQNELTAAFAGRSLAEKAAFAASKQVAESAYLVSKV